MFSNILKSVTAVLALGASTVLSQGAENSMVTRRVIEYLMPTSEQTHEFARVPNSNFILLSQMLSSELVKIEVDPATEEPIAFQSFLMGKNSKSGLHGVWPSTVYPGMMWLSLQTDNQLLLVDPGQDLSTPPAIIRTIDIPAPGNGPHGVFEIGNRVWAGLKVPSEETGKYYVFSADISNNSTSNGQPTFSNSTSTNRSTSAGQQLYPCLNSPVFVAEEPESQLIYVTQDAESSIMSINVTSGETAQLPIPASIGNNPVGMFTGYGPMSGVWFSLAGGDKGGTGSFGHIGSTGELQFFQLKHPRLGYNAGLLHLADASTEADGPALWLLSTSLLSNDSADALIRVTFDVGITEIASEEYIAMPSQDAKVHRVVPMDGTVFVSELATFTLAQLQYNNTVAGQWLPGQLVTSKTPGNDTED